MPDGPSAHEPTSHQYDLAHVPGVRCSCGMSFNIGDTMPDTAAGKVSKRKLGSMRNCWDAYRTHWAEAMGLTPDQAPR